MKKATAAQIKQWKARHKEIFEIEVPLDDKGNKATAYFKKPDLTLIGAASKFSDSDPIKTGNILFEGCWVGGDETIKENDEARLSAMQTLGQLFKVRQATLKKL